MRECLILGAGTSQSVHMVYSIYVSHKVSRVPGKEPCQGRSIYYVLLGKGKTRVTKLVTYLMT